MSATQKNHYRVLIERDEDGFFVATVPSLPGCHTQAKTYADLMRRVREAIELCLDVAKTDASYRKKILLSHEPTFVGMEMVSL
mgnify:CR=1 FL=1